MGKFFLNLLFKVMESFLYKSSVFLDILFLFYVIFISLKMFDKYRRICVLMIFIRVASFINIFLCRLLLFV